MGQFKWLPSDFGIKQDRSELIDMFIDELRTAYRGMWTVDELVSHPQDAIRFCHDFRMKHGMYSLPDHVILKTLMNERKASRGPKRAKAQK